MSKNFSKIEQENLKKEFPINYKVKKNSKYIYTLNVSK